MSGYLAPGFGAGWQAFTNQGIPLSGGKLNTYAAGTSTPLATYSDSTLSTPLANPIILDTTGRPATEIWLTAASYKFVLTDSVGGAISNGTWDNISGLNNFVSASSEWVTSNLTPTYLSTTQFTVTGNQTNVFTVARRVQYTVVGGTYYGYVSAVTFDGISTTTVTIVPDAVNLDNTLTVVNYSLFNSVNPSIPENTISILTGQSSSKNPPVNADAIPLYDSVTPLAPRKLTWANLVATLSAAATAGWTVFSSLNVTGYTTVASATTPDIWTGTGNIISYTGAVTATGFTNAPAAGAQRRLLTTGASAFTASANMLIQGLTAGQTITVVANSVIEVTAISTTQFKLTYSNFCPVIA